MGAADRCERLGLPSADGDDADRADDHSLQGCVASPHCRLPAKVRRAFGGIDGRWLHYGPFGAKTTPLAVHLDDLPDVGGIEHGDVPTWASHRLHVGASLDVFCLSHNPGRGAERMVETVGQRRLVLYRVFAVAWHDPDGPLVEWVARGFGFTREGYRPWPGGGLPTTATHAEIERLYDVLTGRGPRRGRPSRYADQGWREATQRALARRAEQPSLPWDDIAEAVGMSPSALREYRRRLRNDIEQLQLLGEDDS